MKPADEPGARTGEEAEDDVDGLPAAPTSSEPGPGGPYFGRLLIVLLLAVAFCAFMTWILSTTLPD